jgi:Fe-S-cluster containining protein
MDFQSILEKANLDLKINQKKISKIKKHQPNKIDSFFHNEHISAFKKIDCLSCANCCKTTSPIFRDIDIKRISKRLKISEMQLIKQFLYLDKENDYVLNFAPCPFLGSDNYCSIYEDRPLACKEYPHTNRKNMHQILDLTLKNTTICPAVALIVEKIPEKL